MTQQRDILVTTALPYANGPIHIGHLLEHVQSDIWVRFMRLRGHQCLHVCGEDAHGAPIMLNAQKQGITPDALVADLHDKHLADLNAFGIDYTNYHTTHSEENRLLTEAIYQRLFEKGDIEVRSISQAFDPDQGMFLADRFIKGTCPRCGADDQYGDACEACGTTYDAHELKNPRSALSGATPVWKDSEHYFFRLERYEDFLREWMSQGHVQPQVKNKLEEYFEAGLKQWDISRDAPYFGFKIPGTDDKYFYVWMDAPIGYMASFKQWCDKTGADFNAYWGAGAKSELYHFIGKDIIYFHTLFWPAVLSGSGHRTPTNVFAHGFLTINGAKMSKSRGTAISAAKYLEHADPEYLRYYYAAKLGPGLDDIDLSFDDFVARVNSDLVGKLVNIASRSQGFIQKLFDGQLANGLADPELFARFVDAGDDIATHFENREYNRAIRIIMSLADDANRYIDDNAPWKLAKDLNARDEVQSICTMGLNLYRVLMVYLKPVLPMLAEKSEAFLNITPATWDDRKEPLLGHKINAFKPLMQRIQPEQMEKMVEETKSAAEAPAEPKATPEQANSDKETNFISIEDFAKIDLRVAKVASAEHVEGADKLLKIQLDLGDEQRQVFAGIKKFYHPDDLIGRQVIMVANLQPRKMRFGMSEGMILCASNDDGVFVLSPDAGATPGSKVK